MKTTISALVLSTAIAIPAFASTDGNLSQLEILAQDAFQDAGIIYPVTTLTTEQLAQIKALVETDEGDIATELRQIVDVSNPDANTVDSLVPDRSQLEIIAQNELDDAGITYDATQLSTDQLAAIKALSTEDAGDMTSELQEIING